MAVKRCDRNRSHLFPFLSWKSGFHVQVDEALHFFKGIDTVLYLRDAEGEVVGHVGIDGERHFDIVRSGFLSKLHAFIQKYFVSAGLDQHGRKAP